MVWCFVISCAYSHLAEDTPREALKRKFEFKVVLSICVVFLFPRPPSCHIMPLQNDRFPSKHLQDGLALWFFFSQTCNWRLSCLCSWHPSCGSFQKTPTHTQRTTWSLANLFPRGFESWDGKNAANPSVVLLPSIWVLDAFWVYYKMGILKLITQSRFGFFKLLRAPRSQFFVYKLGPKKWLKTAFENHRDEKQTKFNPVLNPFSALIL